jgi:aminoglycoside 3-N-acetyltransferase
MTSSPAEDDARRRLVAALAALGVAHGGTVYLGIDLAGLGLPRFPAARGAEAMQALRDRICGFLHRAVREAVGPGGTILAPAFSYGYARHRTPYEHEASPAEVGHFTEWFRRQPDVIRSFHPLFSVCGEGPAAAAILEDTGRSAFGALSPFARLAAHGTRFVSLGVPLAKWLTYAHHLEQLAGVNHAYHKAFTVPARRGGVDQPGPWLAFVRYLGAGVDISLGGFEERLRADGALHESRDEAGFLQCVAVSDVDRVGLAMLAGDPGAFIASPVTIHIDAPDTGRQPDGPGQVTRFAAEGGASTP